MTLDAEVGDDDTADDAVDDDDDYGQMCSGTVAVISVTIPHANRGE